MKPEHFTNHLLKPGHSGNFLSGEYEEILREFPFCQPAQLLYLKCLQLENDIRFGRQLKIAAVYATDRSILFNLLHDEHPQTAADPEPVVPFVGKAPMPESDSLIAMAIDAPPESDEMSLKDEISGLVPIEDPDLLPFDFPAWEEDDAPVFPSARRAPAFVAATGLPAETGTDESEANRELLREFMASDPLSNWKPTRPGVQSMGTNREMKLPGVPAPKKSAADELIERFISDPSPKLVRPDTVETSDVDISAGSVREDDQFLTETLAGIYVKQGYFLKAIQAYEKLSLKIPEKSIYFASQIEMVRELIKNQ